MAPDLLVAKGKWCTIRDSDGCRRLLSIARIAVDQDGDALLPKNMAKPLDPQACRAQWLLWNRGLAKKLECANKRKHLPLCSVFLGPAFPLVLVLALGGADSYLTAGMKRC